VQTTTRRRDNHRAGDDGAGDAHGGASGERVGGAAARGILANGVGNEASHGRSCVVCLDAPQETIFLECGHACCCTTCAQILLRQPCPVCRTRIARVVRVYHS
jgi:hypothetical protein